MRFFSRLSLLLAAVITLASVGGVLATWVYTDGIPTDASDNNVIHLGVFEYKPEEVLPDKDADGESHISFNDQIRINSKIGLNEDTKKKTFITLLTSRPYHAVYSWENTSGNNIAHIYHAYPSYANLEFTLWYDPDSGDIYSYTYRKEDLNAADVVVNTSKISVYRTHFVKSEGDGTWLTLGSTPGYATVVYDSIDNSRRVIDPSSWQTWPD